MAQKTRGGGQGRSSHVPDSSDHLPHLAEHLLRVSTELLSRPHFELFHPSALLSLALLLSLTTPTLSVDPDLSLTSLRVPSPSTFLTDPFSSPAAQLFHLGRAFNVRSSHRRWCGPVRSRCRSHALRKGRERPRPREGAFQSSLLSSSALFVQRSLLSPSALFSRGKLTRRRPQNPFAGGNSTKATSGINGAGTKAQETLGIKDSAKAFFDDTKASARELARDDLIEVLTGKSGEAVNWLVKSFGLDLSKVSRLGGAYSPSLPPTVAEYAAY